MEKTSLSRAEKQRRPLFLQGSLKRFDPSMGMPDFYTARKGWALAVFKRKFGRIGTHMVVVAQLVRASVCGTEGRGFEPRHPPFSSMRV